MMLVAAAALMVAMLVVTALPAMAHSNGNRGSFTDPGVTLHDFGLTGGACVQHMNPNTGFKQTGGSAGTC
jgi:hypothetical protein